MRSPTSPTRHALLAPLLGLAGAVALAVTTLVLETVLGGPRLPTANARTLLAGTFGALVTIGAFTFWMRPIAAQLAANALPPRTVAVALEDQFQRRTIAATVGALAYEAIILIRLPAADADAAAIPVVTGTALAVTAIVGLLVGMQRAVGATRPGRVLADVASQVMHQLATDEATADPDQVHQPATEGHLVRASASGWVLHIDEHALLAALPPGATARVEVGEGSFVVAGWTPLLTVWPATGNRRDGRNEDHRVDLDHLGNLLHIGDQRSAQLDLPGAVNHLVDIGVHAAGGSGSPSMVYEVMWRLGAVLHEAMRTELGRTARRRQDRAAICWARRLEHGELVSLAVDRLRRATADDPAMALQLVRVLCDVRTEADQRGRIDAIAAIDHQLDLTVDQCRHAGALPADVDEVVRARRGVEGDVPREATRYRGEGDPDGADDGDPAAPLRAGRPAATGRG